MGKECNINYLVCYTTEEMCLQHNTTTYFISDNLHNTMQAKEYRM